MSLPAVLYVADTTIWINLKNHYPQDLFGYIWADLSNLVATGLLRSPEEVLTECQRGTDDLDKLLATELPGLFVPLSNALLKEVARVRLLCPTLQNPNSIKNSADLHVVASASIMQAAVVSHETPARPAATRQKIPDACNTLGIRYLHWHDFLRERKKELGI